jgi:hypothetical protein
MEMDGDRGDSRVYSLQRWCIESELRHLNEVRAPAALEKPEHELWAIFPLGRGNMP